MAYSYPGNPSLPADVKQRVVTTFKQTIEVARKGNPAEATQGCEFILRIDPQFEPARQLSAELTDPFAQTDYDALMELVSGAAGDPLAEARQALADRNFERATELATEVLRDDVANEEAQTIAETAQARAEAEPFVRQFVKSAEDKLAAGNQSGATGDLTKAKQLDPDHPLIRALEARINEPVEAPSGFAFGGAPSFGFGEPPAADLGAPSFVVDETPSASGAPASDFGFTFEEEQRPAPPASADFAFGGGTFSSSAPVEEAGTSHTFDFTTASVETSAEDRAKIDKYLEEGDRLYASGDYQQAIDTWSRVFLIDVTNDDASERIDRARKKRQEIDKRAEELTVAGTLAFEKGDYATARAKFEEVLSLDPNNYTARDHLEKIASAPAGGPAAAPAAAKKPAGDIFADDFDDMDLAEQPLVPPDSAAATAAPAARSRTAAPAATTTAPKASGSKMPLILGLVALLILGGGGFFAWKAMSGRQTSDPAQTRELFTKAERLSKSGKYDQAIALLLTVKPQDPQYEQAVALIDDFKEKKTATSGMIGGRPSAVVFQEQITAARAAFDQKDYLAAKQAFEKASSIQPLPPDAKALYESASAQVAKLNDAMLLMRENRYADAIANLDSLAQQDPQNASVRQMLNIAHYNNGVVELQQENTSAAISEFDAVLRENPNDREARRHRELAARYDGQQKDVMFKIYAKYVQLRQF